MTGADATERISAVIVNWNTADLLDRCLRSLRDPAAESVVSEIVVYDNGSTDGSLEVLRIRWPDVRVLAGQRNIGYTRACNEAVATSTGDLVLLINADAELTSGALDALVARLRSSDDVGAVGPRLVYGDGTWQRWTAGRAPSLTSTLAYLLLLERALAFFADRSVYLARDISTAFMPDWVSSACMLARRAALDDVGPFDDRYFCYMDDVDICQRMRDRGWSVWYEPAALVVHLMSQSTIRRTGAASPGALRNFNDYFRRRHGLAAGMVLRLAEVLGFGLRAGVYAVVSVLRSEDRAQVRAHLRNVRTSMKGGHV